MAAKDGRSFGIGGGTDGKPTRSSPFLSCDLATKGDTGRGGIMGGIWSFSLVICSKWDLRDETGLYDTSVLAFG